MKYLVRWVKGDKRGRVEILDSVSADRLTEKGMVEILKVIDEKIKVIRK